MQQPYTTTAPMPAKTDDSHHGGVGVSVTT